MQRIQDREETLSRNGEDAVASLFDKAVDKKPATGDCAFARGNLGHMQGLASRRRIINLDTVPDWERNISVLDDG